MVFMIQKKHSGVIAEFNRNYIKTDVFDKRFSKIISKAFQIRNRSDYEDFYVVAKEDVAQQIDNAKEFLDVVTEYINSFAEITK